MLRNVLSVESLKEDIEHLQSKIADYKSVIDEIKGLDFYEVGIRKVDNQVCHMTYELKQRTYNKLEAQVIATGLPPSIGNVYVLSLQEWKDGYVEYSPKARTILPKRER